MSNPIFARFHQGHRTTAYPKSLPTLPDRFRGRPTIDPSRCPKDCRSCSEACPTGAISTDGELRIDLGRCLFCTECSDACPDEAISFTTEFRMATRERSDLVLSGATIRLASELEAKARSIFGRSLALRQVSAGGCNGCEADINVLSTVAFDLSRFGIQIVASPRHADGLLITGPVTENMRLALLKTYAAVPAPKLVIAVGACAISGGPYLGRPEVHNGAASLLPVDLFIPGCPPHPLTTLDGLLRLLGRLGRSGRL
jgi:Ni,Fe-hydrogenase III small subunit/NAD-dependent dihydropyrimidine dehydrogenase PreA subunit